MYDFRPRAIRLLYVARLRFIAAARFAAESGCVVRVHECLSVHLICCISVQSYMPTLRRIHQQPPAGASDRSGIFIKRLYYNTFFMAIFLWTRREWRKPREQVSSRFINGTRFFSFLILYPVKWASLYIIILYRRKRRAKRVSRTMYIRRFKGERETVVYYIMYLYTRFLYLYIYIYT